MRAPESSKRTSSPSALTSSATRSATARSLPDGLGMAASSRKSRRGPDAKSVSTAGILCGARPANGDVLLLEEALEDRAPRVGAVEMNAVTGSLARAA